MIEAEEKQGTLEIIPDAPTAEVAAEGPAAYDGAVGDGDGGDSSEAPEVDYAEVMASDLKELLREFPELRGIESLTDIKNPLRYAALRDMGLTPTEAYLAARGKSRHDTRSHLTGGIPKPAGIQGGSMPRSELEGARELFFGMSDSEIQSLWRRVTK